MLITYQDLVQIFLTDFLVDVALYLIKHLMVDVEYYLIKHLLVDVALYPIKFLLQFFNKLPMG